MISGDGSGDGVPSYQELFLRSKRGIFPLTERVLPEGRHAPTLLFQDTTRYRDPTKIHAKSFVFR